MRIPLIPASEYLRDLSTRAGLSDGAIGKAVGMTRSSVWRLRTGLHKTTRDEFGVRIRNFHAKTFNRLARGK